MHKVGAIFVENTRIKTPDIYSVYSEIIPKQNIEAVGHGSKSDFAHCIAAVFKVAFKKVDFAKVQDRVLWRKHIKWNSTFWNLNNF